MKRLFAISLIAVLACAALPGGASAADKRLAKLAGVWEYHDHARACKLMYEAIPGDGTLTMRFVGASTNCPLSAREYRFRVDGSGLKGSMTLAPLKAKQGSCRLPKKDFPVTGGIEPDRKTIVIFWPGIYGDLKTCTWKTGGGRTRIQFQRR